MKAVSRRGFVQVAGIGAAGLLAGKASALTFSGSQVGSLTAGLMLPTDGSYGRMSDSFVDGFRMAMDELRVNASLVSRPVSKGYGGARAAASDLLGAGVDVVVGGVTTPVAKLVTPLFAEKKIPLVVANVGGHVPLASDRSDYVVHNSLLYWQASFALGKRVATNIARRGFIASSLADSGYDALFAFRRGFESAGGTIAGTGLSHVDPKSPGLNELLAAIRAASPSVVYAHYTGPAGADFLKAYASSGLSAPLVGSGLLVDDYLIDTIGSASKGVKTAASWTRADPAAANKTFCDAYQQRTGRKADPFAVLGYDTAKLVVTGFQNTKQQGASPSRFVSALAGASIDSPRGTLTVDGSTNTLGGPISLRQVQGSLGQYQNVVVAALPAVPSFPSQLSDLTSGTTNAYYNEVLCA